MALSVKTPHLKIPYSACLIAHNEARCIGRTLESLTQQTHKPSEILVWANGCCDETANIAREYGASVYECSFANKPHGWNELNTVAKYDHRIFFDADVLVPPRSCERLMDSFWHSGALVSAARIVPRYDSLSQLTRFVFPVQLLPQTYVCGRMYGLDYPRFISRAEEKEIPTDILHEDGWVQLMAQNEFTVSHARVLYREYAFSELPRICQRYHDASLQLRQRYSHLKRPSYTKLTSSQKVKAALPFIVAKTLHLCLRQLHKGELGFSRSEHSKRAI
jgi:glycosyltransferase involved in cell wall biosynthesis